MRLRIASRRTRDSPAETGEFLDPPSFETQARAGLLLRMRVSGARRHVPGVVFQVEKKNCCGRAGPGFGQDQAFGYFSGTFCRLFLQMPKALTARQMPTVSNESAAMSKICFMISPRF